MAFSRSFFLAFSRASAALPGRAQSLEVALELPRAGGSLLRRLSAKVVLSLFAQAA
jgi:hypothetical protein